MSNVPVERTKSQRSARGVRSIFIATKSRIAHILSVIFRGARGMPVPRYVLKAPHRQNILDIFDGEWTSRMPNHPELITQPGTAALFADPRIDWVSDRIGGFAGLRILELGSLEAGHTYMMHRGGAREIVCVEANTHAFLKCLCIKEVFELSRAKFLLGDLSHYLSNLGEQFDLCVASGVLYHMTDPIGMLRYAAEVSPTLYLWSHYYDEKTIAHSAYAPLFGPPATYQEHGQSFTGVKRYYGQARDRAGFLGGANAYALWLTKDSLFDALHGAGFNDLVIDRDELCHPNGPAISILARRSAGCS